MRLKSKRTGEIGYLYEHSLLQDIIIVYDVKGIVGKYTSLAELNEEWEDYDEPKEYYVINPVDWKEVIGKIEYRNDNTDKINKQIGNYFETKEEAEKAVERLRALKRLKDKGFRFTGYSHYDWNGNESPAIAFEYSDFDEMFDDKQVVADLDLLFGGEE